MIRNMSKIYCKSLKIIKIIIFMILDGYNSKINYFRLETDISFIFYFCRNSPFLHLEYARYHY